MPIQIDHRVDQLLQGAASNVQIRMNDLDRNRSMFTMDQWNLIANMLVPIGQLREAVSLLVRDLRRVR